MLRHFTIWNFCAFIPPSKSPNFIIPAPKLCSLPTPQSLIPLNHFSNKPNHSCKFFQGHSQGRGIWWSEAPPPIAPNLLVIFNKTLTKQRLGAYPQHFCNLKTPSFGYFWPQNPLLRSFLAMPLARGLGHLSLPWVWKQFPSYKQNDFNPFHEKFGFSSSCGIWFIYFGTIRDL